MSADKPPEDFFNPWADASLSPNERARHVLRHEAEKIAKEKIAWSQDDPGDQTPEETARTLQELRVHQIELEMQNGELRQAQVELDAARSRYYSLFNLAPIAYFTVGEKGLIRECNLTAATLLGVDRSGLVNRPFSGFVRGEDQDAYYLSRKELFRAGEPTSCELRMKKADGSPFWGRLDSIVLQDEDDGQCSRMVLIDISERKLAADTIKQDDLLLRRMVDMLQRPELSLREFLGYLIEQAVELTGSAYGFLQDYDEPSRRFSLVAQSRNMPGQCLMGAAEGGERLEAAGLWAESVKRRAPYVVNDLGAANARKKGYPKGHPALRRMLSVPVFKGSGIVGLVCLADKAPEYTEFDVLQVSVLMESAWKVTERMHAEEALHASFRENKRLLRELQHRAKNSFSMISSMISLAACTEKRDSPKAVLDDLGRRVRSVAELYSLLYSSGSCTEVRLDEYCRRIALPIIELSDGVALETELDGLSVQASDAAPIGLVLTELMTNAIKYGFPDGRKGTVAVSLKASERGVMLEVRDDGIGLPADFARETAAGMGLNLVDALSKQLRGSFALGCGGHGTSARVEFILTERSHEDAQDS